MMAKVRRRAISLAKSLFKKNVIGTVEVGNVNSGGDAWTEGHAVEALSSKTMNSARLRTGSKWTQCSSALP